MNDKNKDQLKRFNKTMKEAKVIFDTIYEASEKVTAYGLNYGSRDTGTVNNLTSELNNLLYLVKKLNKARNILKEF